MKMRSQIHDVDKLKWLSNAKTRTLKDLYLVCHLGGKINLRIDSRTSCIHSGNIKEPRCFHYMLICGNFKPETSVGNFQKLNIKEMSRYKLLQWHKITTQKIRFLHKECKQKRLASPSFSIPTSFTPSHGSFSIRVVTQQIILRSLDDKVLYGLDPTILVSTYLKSVKIGSIFTWQVHSNTIIGKYLLL